MKNPGQARTLVGVTHATLRLLLVMVAVTAAYLPSLQGGYIDFDDDWMLRDNPLLQSPRLSHIARIWFDGSLETRLSLGAEYLPVRDSVVLLQTLAFGASTLSLRLLNLALYLVATLLCIVSTRRLLGQHWMADAAAMLFALHPVHAESVAWLVGTKDVLGLCFFWGGAALALDPRKDRAGWVVPLLVLAQLSKALFVVGPLLVGLLLCFPGAAGATDRQWRARLRMVVASGLACAVAAWTQVAISRATTMLDSPEALTHVEAFRAMGETWWRYLRTTFFFTGLNVLPETSTARGWTFERIAGHAFVLLMTVAAGFAFWIERLRPIASAWLWFVIALLPVSQIVFVLQNPQADRYLVVAVYSAALTLGLGLKSLQGLVDRTSTPVLRLCGPTLALIVVGNAWLFSTYRAVLFSDPVLLFQDATKKTQSSPRAPYQLAMALEKRGAWDEALMAYRTALFREHGGAESARRATNNLARLHVRRGELRQAETVLRSGLPLWPEDPKILGNLAEVVRLQGRTAEAHQLYSELLRRFPDYETGAARYRTHFGSTDR